MRCISNNVFVIRKILYLFYVISPYIPTLFTISCTLYYIYIIRFLSRKKSEVTNKSEKIK